MKISPPYVVLVFLAIVVLFVAGCEQKPAMSKRHSAFIDSLSVDSLTFWEDHLEADRAAITAYIMDTSVAVYVLRGDHLYLDTVLQLGDSVTVKKNNFELYFGHKFYAVSYHGRDGYIRGTSLGFGLVSDFDNDGKPDLLIYGYTTQNKDSFMEFPLNSFTVKFVSSGGLVSELHDTAYNNISLNEVSGVRLSKKIHCYELSTGYPACAYPQFHFIIAYGNGKAEIIHKSVTSMDSGFGDFCEFSYPVDSTRRSDTIYISHRLAMPLSETNDSIVYSTTDSMILYLHEGKWGSKTYQWDTIKRTFAPL